MSESTFLWGAVTQLSPLRVRLDGDAAALAATPSTLVDVNALAVADRVRCELGNNRLIVHGRYGGPAKLNIYGPLSGTTAARDAYFGTPATDAARLALQGKAWYNTDKGWTERYYALYNASTQPLGQSRMANGWYPVEGMLPIYRAHRTVGINWGTTDTPMDFDYVDENVGGFVHSTVNVTPPIPGRYHVLYRLAVATGSTIYTNGKLRVGTSVVANIQQGPHGTSFGGNEWHDTLPLDTANALSVWLQSSGALVQPLVDSGANLVIFTMKYLGPA